MSENLRDSKWDRDGVIYKILKDTPLPKMAKVSQHFDSKHIEDIPSVVRAEFDKPEIAKTIKKGMSICITCGSRGLASIDVIIREVVTNVKRLGGEPFIIPAMGSHGGATAEGQQQVVEGLGVTEEFCGAPIRSTMETVIIGKNKDGIDVRIDKYAAASDGIIVLGRVKPHTAFRGKYESGLHKMCAIGLAKQEGAQVCHVDGFGKMDHNVEAFGDAILEKAPVIFGLATVENAFDQTCIIEAVPVNKINKREPELLSIAYSLMPKIYIDDIDILVIDQIGKNFSGDGMDPNITGSFSTPFATGGPNVQRYVVLDLSEETHGNALGLGQADFSTKRVYDKIDYDAAYPNALTCTVVTGVRVPLILKNDKLALQAAIFTCVGIDKKRPRIVRISNSSHITHIFVSEALKEDVKQNENMVFESDFSDISFDAEDNLELFKI